MTTEKEHIIGRNRSGVFITITHPLTGAREKHRVSRKLARDHGLRVRRNPNDYSDADLIRLGDRLVERLAQPEDEVGVPTPSELRLDFLELVEATSPSYNRFRELTLKKIVGEIGEDWGAYTALACRRALQDLWPKDSDSTRRKRFFTLQSFLKRAVAEGGLRRNPLEQFQAPAEPCPEIRVFSEEEILALFRGTLPARQHHNDPRQEKGRPELARFLAVTVGLGLRRGETAGLTWEDLDFATSTAKIRSRKNRRHQLVERRVVIPAFVSALLGSSNGRTGLVCLNSCGRPWQEQAMRRATKALRELSGIQDFNYRILRTTFASFLVDQGVDPFTVDQLLGHSTRAVSRIGARHYLRPRDLAKVRAEVDEAFSGIGAQILEVLAGELVGDESSVAGKPAAPARAGFRLLKGGVA